MHAESVSFSDSVILQYRPRTGRDVENVLALRQLLKTCPNPFERPVAVGHVTATAFIVDQAHKKTLLIHHRKLDLWLSPGGHCDGMADVRDVALKEAQEETGLSSLALVHADIFDIDIHTIPANARDPDHLHFDVRFLFEADNEEPLKISHESHAGRWIPLNDLEAVTAMPSVLILKEKLAAL